jgi:hypothetical protein
MPRVMRAHIDSEFDSWRKEVSIDLFQSALTYLSRCIADQEIE